MGGADAGVLIVDDNPDTRESIKFLLEAHGYTVQTAEDGRDALDQLRGGPVPNLILLDLMMPRMDGFAFRQAQLQDQRLARIPVIVYSGHHDPEANAERLQAAAYFQKPVDVDALMRLVETHVRAAQPTS